MFAVLLGLYAELFQALELASRSIGNGLNHLIKVFAESGRGVSVGAQRLLGRRKSKVHQLREAFDGLGKVVWRLAGEVLQRRECDLGVLGTTGSGNEPGVQNIELPLNIRYLADRRGDADECCRLDSQAPERIAQTVNSGSCGRSDIADFFRSVAKPLKGIRRLVRATLGLINAAVEFVDLAINAAD